MAEYQVTCVKHDQSKTIIGIGSDTLRWTSSQAIADIVSGTNRFFTYEDGTKAYVHVVTKRDGTRYLHTDPDGIRRNNLDLLPPCG